MTEIIFEHPLTEKMRTWLRLENLLDTIFEVKSVETDVMALSLLKSLIELSEVLERGDIKVDLYKDLDRLLGRFAIWAESPDVDHAAIKAWQVKLNSLAQNVKQVARFNAHLQNDKLLNTIRQRLSIPGGCCNFDLPTLHVWLHLPKKTQMQIIDGWVSPLVFLKESITTIVSLTRNTGAHQVAVAKKGFFQDVAENKELLRVKLDVTDLIYPQISGVKNRFMIRFLPYDADNGTVPDELEFVISSC
ncbi:cell division protein ZapD [Thorsellia anophelis]|uniref:Cell division protein ZapD n=1 Tax=Thorsellia anophelis DSM 18579 TaxID=1123402 RepID=A0A1H9YDN3_9GAMM|nr:cell division protein ZapD [Thorsellia anophelis]SES66664.1 cell division protein ZapD [Thorsellia anophelis DSM 18579]